MATPRVISAEVGPFSQEPAPSRVPFVSVAIRVKPVPRSEQLALWAKDPEDDGGGQHCTTICCHKGYIIEEHEFSRVIGPRDSNRQVFEDLNGAAVASSVFAGVNETLIAYGQTGSGKTHTIFGTSQEPGLLGFFVGCIFDHMQQLAPQSTVHVCCYEVLGDTLTDLLDPAPFLEYGEINVTDVVFDELFLKTQKCRYQIVRVETPALCMRLLEHARINRTTGVSSCNQTSSRSHAVVHIFVQNVVRGAPCADSDSETGRDFVAGTTIGTLSLVDLAGAEREYDNPSEKGRKSTRLLNTSLSSLNRLLRKLQMGSLDESERRQSVLNKCLWEYLRPGCGIALVFCVSPLAKHRTVALSTLAMATDSKLIHSRRKTQFLAIGTVPSDLATPKSAIAASLGKESCFQGQRLRSFSASTISTQQRRRNSDHNSVQATPTRCAGRSEQRSVGSATRDLHGDHSRASIPVFTSKLRRSRTELKAAMSPAGQSQRTEIRHALSCPSSCSSPERSCREPFSTPGYMNHDCNMVSCRDIGNGADAPMWNSMAPPQTERQALKLTVDKVSPRRMVSGPASVGFGANARIRGASTGELHQHVELGVDSNSDEHVQGKCIHLQTKKFRPVRRKLSRTRARSQERLVHAERELGHLSEENAALKRECASLRSLFIQQQREHLAFWSGPFMDLVGAPKGAVPLLSRAEPSTPSPWGSPLNRSRALESPLLEKTDCCTGQSTTSPSRRGSGVDDDEEDEEEEEEDESFCLTIPSGAISGGRVLQQSSFACAEDGFTDGKALVGNSVDCQPATLHAELERDVDP